MTRNGASNRRSLVIFDLDDTLTDNRGLDYAFLVHLHDKFGLPEIGQEALRSLRARHWRARTILQRLTRKGHMEGRLQEFTSLKRDFYDSRIDLHQLKPGVRSGLDSMGKAGFELGVATGRRRRRTVMTILKRLQIEHCFAPRFICCMSDIGRREGEGERFKGEMYQFILQKAGHRFDHIFAVGNLYSDLAPAKRLGLIPIGMKGSYYLQPEVRRGFPVARDFTTLPRLVARLARS